MTKTPQPQCRNCRFYCRQESQAGDCRRYPPSLIDQLLPKPVAGGAEFGERYVATQFPAVNFDDWCGEHKRKEPGE